MRQSRRRPGFAAGALPLPGVMRPPAMLHSNRRFASPLAESGIVRRCAGCGMASAPVMAGKRPAVIVSICRAPMRKGHTTAAPATRRKQSGRNRRAGIGDGRAGRRDRQAHRRDRPGIAYAGRGFRPGDVITATVRTGVRHQEPAASPPRQNERRNRCRQSVGATATEHACTQTGPPPDPAATEVMAMPLCNLLPDNAQWPWPSAPPLVRKTLSVAA